MTEHFHDRRKLDGSASTPAVESGATKPHAGRRRFVKHAAIAAPAIMTLRGGQALAQSSFSLSSCLAERSEMGQVAQNAMGDEMYFVVDVNSRGINVSAASADTPGAQTVTASCMASLI